MTNPNIGGGGTPTERDGSESPWTPKIVEGKELKGFSSWVGRSLPSLCPPCLPGLLVVLEIIV